jgi:hypothetical protein
MSHGHFITTCGDCGVVIAQCRCFVKDKIKRTGTCERCKKEKEALSAEFEDDEKPHPCDDEDAGYAHSTTGRENQ